MLLAIGLRELDPGDLGDGIPFIGRLKTAGEQRILVYRLGGVFRVDAGGAEEQ